MADYAAIRRSCSPSSPRSARRRRRCTSSRGDWFYALVIFTIGNVGVASSYESLLPHLVGPEQLDIVSAAGYGIGYRRRDDAIDALLMAEPQWFDSGSRRRGAPQFRRRRRLRTLFSIPIFRRVAEPPRRLESDESTPGKTRS